MNELGGLKLGRNHPSTNNGFSSDATKPKPALVATSPWVGQPCDIKYLPWAYKEVYGLRWPYATPASHREATRSRCFQNSPALPPVFASGYKSTQGPQFAALCVSLHNHTILLHRLWLRESLQTIWWEIFVQIESSEIVLL